MRQACVAGLLAVVVASIACGPPPLPRSADGGPAGSPLGPSYVLMPLPGDDDALLGRVLTEQPTSGRALEEISRPNPCADKLSEARTSPQAATFEDAQELSQSASAKVVLQTFGFSGDVEQASHFFYKLETSKRVARTDTVEYLECCKAKGCGYGYVSALVYGEGEYASGSESRASGSVDVVVAGGGGGVRLKVLHKRKVRGWLAALVTVTDKSKASEFGPLGVAASAGITEASIPETVKDLYERDKIRVEGNGDGYRFIDGRGKELTENEFLRRYRAATGSSELDPLERRRNPIKTGILGGLTALSVGMVAYGFLTQERYCQPDDYPVNDACSGPAGVSGFQRYQYFPRNKTKDDDWQPYVAIGGLGALGFGTWLVFALLDRDGAPTEHYLSDRDAVLYSGQYNRALLRKTVRDVEKSVQKSSTFRVQPLFWGTGLGLGGTF